jgi:hypothetical protein
MTEDNRNALRTRPSGRVSWSSAKSMTPPPPSPSDWRAIAEYEPPTFAAPFLWHRGEQAPRLLIRERKQCEFLASVKRGDDPRRPTAEPSAARIEQNRAREVIGGHYAGVHVLGPFQKTMPPRSRLK